MSSKSPTTFDSDFSVEALIEGLASQKKVITFYGTVYSYLLCNYSVFLDQVIPEEDRAPIPESLLQRFASGNRFEARHVGELLWAQTAEDNPIVFPAGEFKFLDSSGDPVDMVRDELASAPPYRTFGLVADGEFHALPDDGRKRNPLVARLASESDEPLMLVAFDDYHEIEDQTERRAMKAQIASETVQAMADGVAAMKDGSAAPIIVAPRLPRTYVEELDADLVGEPDLLVPVPSLGSYTSVDYKDASVLGQSTRTLEWLAAPATSPFLEDVSESDLGSGLLQKKHRLQLFHYQLMLEPLLEALGAKATPWAAIIGREGLAVWSDLSVPMYGRGRSLSSPADIYLKTVEESQEAASLGERFATGADVELPVDLGPAKVAACGECVFRKHCDEERRRNGGHLTLHPDIGAGKSLQVGELLAAPTLEDLSYADAAELTQKVQELDVKGFGQEPDDVHPKLQSLVDGARAIHVGRSYRRRDQARVPTLEAVLEVHLDLENNNNPMANGVVPANHWFQTGWVTKKGVDDLSEKVTTRYSCRFTDGTDASEAEMYRSFWSSMDRLTSEAESRYDEIAGARGAEAYRRLSASGGTEALDEAAQRLDASSRTELKAALGAEALSGIVPFRAFVYSPAEFRIMRAKSRQHAGVPGVPTEDEIGEWFTPQTPGRPESAIAVDLCDFLKTYVHLPLPDRKLKTVAPYVGHYWDVDDPSGLAATFKADEMFSSPGTEVAEAARDWLWTYNKADCIANLEVRRWIDSIPWKGIEKLDSSGVFRARFPRRALRRRTEATLFDAAEDGS